MFIFFMELGGAPFLLSSSRSSSKKIRDAEAEVIVRFGFKNIYMIVEKENHWILDKHVNDSRDVTSKMIKILKERYI